MRALLQILYLLYKDSLQNAEEHAKALVEQQELYREVQQRLLLDLR